PRETRELVGSLNQASSTLATQARAIEQALAEVRRHGDELDQRNHELDAILAINPNGLLALDAQDRVRFASAAFGRFTGLDPAPRATGRPGRGGPPGAGAQMPTGPRNCHDVTAYPAAKLLAGACGSYGLLVDVSNPEKPVRVDAKADTNFSLWHTAVFSNDGKKVVFTDE
ncbi:MAG: hypothetical protein JNK74_30430, partial [Candidatus Hydrogenedentes bacterium]|nr:hypothetical protein [Candidatus Hydrogenedentota bacterium]